MNIRFVTALKRRRLRRRLLIEAAILNNMKEAEKDLKKGIPAQEERVKTIEDALGDSLSVSDIARRLDRECKAPLLAA